MLGSPFCVPMTPWNDSIFLEMVSQFFQTLPTNSVKEIKYNRAYLLPIVTILGVFLLSFMDFLFLLWVI